MSSGVRIFPCAIPIGASLSAAVDFQSATALRGIQMPAAWDAAVLTFQVSVDGVTYSDFYDYAGAEYTVQAAAGRIIAVMPDDFLSVRYLKVRSGTSGVPVNQAAARSLTLIARNL